MMRTPKVTNNPLLALLKTYWQWRWLWIFTTIAFGGMGAAYALVLKKDRWVAAQALIVRDEAGGGVMRLGRFQSQTEMKAAQETVLEMARNPQVLQAALTTVGRDPNSAPPSWLASLFGKSALPKSGPPTAGEIEALAKEGIEVRAPRGAELGTTEVIYVDVEASTPERAIALNIAVCDELEKHLQLVRRTRADGVIEELKTASVSARAALDASTVRLQEIEEAVGADLSDLRGLTDSNSGGSTNRQLLDTVKNELLVIQLKSRQLQAEYELASEALDTPERLFAAPAKLLSENPGVLKLREGLAAASLATSSLRSRYTPEHHRVIEALETEVEIKEQLRAELALAVTSLKQDLQIAEARIEQLNQQRKQLESSLEKLASVRAEYGNVVAEVAARNDQLQQAEFELAQAVASRNAAGTSSLVNRLDNPIVGETPIGPGRSTILAGAAVAGLMFGCGIVFLLSPLDSGNSGFGRRATDAFGIGRRASDQVRVAVAGAMDTRQSGSAPWAQAGGERRSRPRDGEDRRSEESLSGITAQADTQQDVSLPAIQTPSTPVSNSTQHLDTTATEVLGEIGGLSFSQHANQVRPKASKSNQTVTPNPDSPPKSTSGKTTAIPPLSLSAGPSDSTPVAGLTGR